MKRRRQNPSAKDDPIRHLYPQMKAALKRVVASGDPDAIIRHVDAALDRFEIIGYPDQWHDWERAKDDAIMAKRHRSKWNPRHRRNTRKSYSKYGSRRKSSRRHRKSRRGKR